MGRTLRRATALSLTLGLVAQGCFPHVQLAAAPPREAPSHVRLGFYQAHRPVALNTQTTVMFNRYGYAGTSTSVEGVLLGNGTLVRRADDLRPLVDPDSATVQHAERSERARDVMTGLLVGGLAATVAGLGMLFPALTAAADSSGGRDSGSDALLWTSIGLSLAGSVLSLVAAYGPGATAAQERLAAFQALDDSLRRRLNLCERPPMIVDCATEAPAPGPAPGPAPWGAPPPPAQVPAAPAPLTTPTTM